MNGSPMALVAVYSFGFFVSVFGIVFLVRYLRKLRDPTSDLHSYWTNHLPRYYRIMVFGIPVVVAGLALILLNCSLSLVVAMLRFLQSTGTIV